MRFVGKILVTAIAALIASYLLPGVIISSGITAIIIALVLALLNTFIKPVLVILTIPITVLTLGLFLLLINTVIIKWTAYLVGPNFVVQNWWAAFWFSILLSVVTYIIEALIGDKKEKNN